MKVSSKFCGALLLILVSTLASADPRVIESSSEAVNISVYMTGPDTGILVASKCEKCVSEKYIIDDTSVIKVSKRDLSFNESYSVYYQSGIIFYDPNTLVVLRANLNKGN